VTGRPPFTVHRSPFTLFLFTVHCSLFTASCGGIGLSPLRRHAEVGKDAYLVFVADGPGGRGDLFGVRSDGGAVFQITYTTVAEAAPALSPDGSMVAFLRARSLRDSVPSTLWVLSLVNGGERELVLPAGAGRPERVGWAADGRSLFVRAAGGVYRVRAPPGAPEPHRVTAAERPRADSALAVLLGDPPFARAVPCGSSLCVQGDTGSPAPFAEAAHDPVRWGPDSVGYLTDAALLVRPVGPGRSRRVAWKNVPASPRELTYFPGNSVNGER
jgi:hypothetical protein